MQFLKIRIVSLSNRLNMSFLVRQARREQRDQRRGGRGGMAGSGHAPQARSQALAAGRYFADVISRPGADFKIILSDPGWA